MGKDLKELLERLEKADPDSFQDFTDIIERHTKNTEKLNMLLGAIPKLIAQQTGENEREALNIQPDLLSCDTPDEVCEVINKWIGVKLGRISIDDMYSLDWPQILHKAFQNRPTSWGNIEPTLVEYRNAGDCIAGQVIREMKKKELIKEKP